MPGMKGVMTRQRVCLGEASDCPDMGGEDASGSKVWLQEKRVRPVAGQCSQACNLVSDKIRSDGNACKKEKDKKKVTERNC